MSEESKKIICLTPVYNDWESFMILAAKIAEVNVDNENYSFQIVVVNDGSTDEFDEADFSMNLPIKIITLKANVGHQRAIAIGLHYINDARSDYDFVVVLDSDGEDKPEDILRLVSKCEDENSKKIIFAQRKKRHESFLFMIGYFFYKHIFRLLTGQKINFGNFSCIPKIFLKRITILDSLWNHYSGAIIQSKTPYDGVFLDKGKRYAGQSKMNFNSLVIHGLSSISVYFDSLSVRILKLSFYGIMACFVAVTIVLYKKFITETAIPGWTSNLIFIIFSIILQLSSVTLIILLMQLSSRKNIQSPSMKIYKDFIEEIKEIKP